MKAYENFKVSFKNEHLILENNIKCTIKEYEMNYSQNPSVRISGSSDFMLSFASGSNFTPYATTLGLYNDNSELLAVVKFSQPVPISADTDTNFWIKVDV